MKTLTVVFVFLLFSADLAASAEQKGEMIPCPEHRVGELYRFRSVNSLGKISRGSVTITKVEGGLVEAVTGSGRVDVYDRVFNHMKLGPREFTPKYYSRPECPFYLGEVRNYNVEFSGARSGSAIKGRIKTTVDTAFTTVSTEIGNFKTVKITMEMSYNWTGVGSSSGSGRCTIRH